MTVEASETREEITYTNTETDASEAYSSSVTSLTSDHGSRRETVETDQITQASREERKRFVIKAVLDPRTGQQISIVDAVRQGVVDQAKGLYVNPETGEGLPIPQAMAQGKIIVEYSTVRTSQEKIKAVGLITIKTRCDNRNYSIVKCIDAITGERVGENEATARGLLVREDLAFYIRGERVDLDDAIDSGWVIVDYDEGSLEPEYENKSYVVNAVVDQRRKKKVPFYEGVKRGLIEQDTGNYVNNLTNERIYVTEAIRRGFLKAKLVEDTSGLEIDSENHMVIDRIDTIRKNVLKPISVLSAMKKAGRNLQYS